MKPVVLFSTVFFSILLPSFGLGAFERSRDPDTHACLWWRNRTIDVYLNQACSADVSFQDCESAILLSMQEWSKPTCSDFAFHYSGTTEESEIGFDQKDFGNNINLVVWKESSWEPSAQKALALTTLTYNRDTGELFDADLEMNGKNFTFSTTESSNTTVDIQNTATHEMGHMLGLEHSSDTSATMYLNAILGETKKRDLAQDDIDGLCLIYPSGMPLGECGGFTPPTNDDGGCKTSGPAGLAGWLSLVPVFLILGLLRRFRLNYYSRKAS